MKLHWTDHSKIKMRQYALSKSKLLQLISKPERKERGIAAGTTAVMSRLQSNTGSRIPTKSVSGQTNSNKPFKYKKPPGEIWLMYKDVKASPRSGPVIRKIISAWRYPGISKPGESIPIPEDIYRELQSTI